MTGEYSSPEFRARFTEQARQAAANSDAIIAVSQSTATHVEQLLGVEPSRIHVVPHGSPQVAAVSAARRENLVLFVGVIQKRKNVGRLVKAFERLPAGWRLALAGASQGYGAAEELRAVEESPRRADIDILGHLSSEQLAALYARARIFAFPSLDEGFGMPILEAMAHGVPVITSQSSAMPEVAGDAALLVDPLNIDQLAHALNASGRRRKLAGGPDRPGPRARAALHLGFSGSANLGGLRKSHGRELVIWLVSLVAALCKSLNFPSVTASEMAPPINSGSVTIPHSTSENRAASAWA